ncbi:MAG: hypothetical protein VKP72_05625 [bacterium]|nr:hypothetical protein [bacterium]
MDVRSKQGAMARQLWQELQDSTLQAGQARRRERADALEARERSSGTASNRPGAAPGPAGAAATRPEAPGQLSAGTRSGAGGARPQVPEIPRQREATEISGTASPALRAYRAAMTGGMVPHQWDLQA